MFSISKRKKFLMKYVLRHRAYCPYIYTVPIAVSNDEARLLGRVKLNGNSCLPLGRLGPLNGIIS